jgi:SAM-dependent methyltransferase
MLTVDFSKIRLKPGVRVLDAGCGKGRHLHEAYKCSGVKVVGLDRKREDVTEARNMIRLLEKVGEGGEGAWGVLEGDITRLPFADDSFDVVICSEVLEHIPDEAKAIEEIARVLKPGETLVVSVPRYFPEKVCWALSKAYRNEPGGHIRIYRKRELIRKLEKAGLVCFDTGWAHGLHAPYWWLKCMVGLGNENSRLVKMYHDFLVWDIEKRPWLTRTLEKMMNPFVAKSCVLYLRKGGNGNGNQDPESSGKAVRRPGNGGPSDSGDTEKDG